MNEVFGVFSSFKSEVPNPVQWVQDGAPTRVHCRCAILEVFPLDGTRPREKEGLVCHGENGDLEQLVSVVTVVVVAAKLVLVRVTSFLSAFFRECRGSGCGVNGSPQ